LPTQTLAWSPSWAGGQAGPSSTAASPPTAARSQAAAEPARATRSPFLPLPPLLPDGRPWHLHPAAQTQLWTRELFALGWKRQKGKNKAFVCHIVSFCVNLLPSLFLSAPSGFLQEQSTTASALSQERRNCFKRFRETVRAYKIALPLFSLHCPGY